MAITVTTAADLLEALINASGEVAIEVAGTIDLTAGDILGFEIPAGLNATITLNEGVSVIAQNNAFRVPDNTTLTLNGSGTIVSTSKQTKGAITIEGTNAVLNINGITIDAYTHNGKAGNYAYGIYVLGGATVNVNSGTIKVAYGSCVSTNNTTGGGEVNIKGGELLADGSYAIYNAAQGTVNITGGRVQGINARMGNFNISGDAEIVPTAITLTDYDDIGLNIATSGCIWFGDTIAFIAGTYNDANGVDFNLNISGNATVRSNFRSAIGVYLVDTNEAANVDITVSNESNISTTAESFDAITIYDHEYIAAAALMANKTYTPTVQSTANVSVVPDSPTDPFNGMAADDIKAIADAANTEIKTKEEEINETSVAVLNRVKTVASTGAYEANISFDSSTIPFTKNYRTEVINKLKRLGYEVQVMYYANSENTAWGINVRWG